MLAALESHLHLVLADGALEPEDDLLGRLGLLVEDGLGLTTVTTLLPVVTALTLGEEGGLNHRREHHQQWLTTTIPVSRALTLPALYWVTLCCWCLWQSLDLQYVRRVLGMLTCAER